MDFFPEKRFETVLAGFPLAALMGYYGLEIATASSFYQDTQNLEILKAYGTLVSGLGLAIIFFIAYVAGTVFLEFSGIYWFWREKKYKLSYTDKELKRAIILLAVFLCSVTALITDFVYRACFQGMPVRFGLGVIAYICILLLVAKTIRNAVSS